MSEHQESCPEQEGIRAGDVDPERKEGEEPEAADPVSGSVDFEEPGAGDAAPVPGGSEVETPEDADRPDEPDIDGVDEPAADEVPADEPADPSLAEMSNDSDETGEEASAGDQSVSDEPLNDEMSSDEPVSDETPGDEESGDEELVGDELTTQQVIEAILFITDTPLSLSKIGSILGVGTARDIRKHIQTLNQRYEAAGASFRIDQVANGYQMLTLPQFNTWLRRLKQSRQDTRLSQAALETLAVVAYKQPVVRAEIEAVRGVASGEMLNRLRELGLVKIVGRAEDVGRPMLYGTTRRFLEVFGLSDLGDLPEIEELQSNE